MYELFVSITCVTVTISILYAVFSIKKLVKNVINEQKAEIKAEVEAWLNSETGQKAIYSIGALLGNAIASGAGFTKKSGKFSLQDIIMQGIGSFIKAKTGFGQEQEEQPQASNTRKGIPEA